MGFAELSPSSPSCQKCPSRPGYPGCPAAQAAPAAPAAPAASPFLTSPPSLGQGDCVDINECKDPELAGKCEQLCLNTRGRYVLQYTSHYLTWPHTPRTTSHDLKRPHTTSHDLTLSYITSHYQALAHTTSHYLALYHNSSKFSLSNFWHKRIMRYIPFFSS